jgi:catechol 2,3-dioxygenase-like lactoylglutathione lyase family enzyme
MNPLGISHLDHVSVLVTDIGASRHFYGTLLGLTEVPGPRTFEFVVLWYSLGNGQYLHLLLKDAPDVRSPRHFALAVRDVNAVRAHCRANGIPTEDTVAIPGADRCFVHDPAGNRIELIQWLRPYDPSTDGKYQV